MNDDLTDEQRARALELRNTWANTISGLIHLEALPARHSHAWLALEAYVLASHTCEPVWRPTTRDEIQAGWEVWSRGQGGYETDAAEASLARVRGLHERESFWRYHRDQEYSYLTQQDAADESGCDCPYLAHTPECLATISHFDVCSECARIEYADAERQAHGEFSGYAEAMWPCPTIRALDATPPTTTEETTHE